MLRLGRALTIVRVLLKALEQALQILELERLARGLAQPPPQLLEDLARPLDVDLIGHLDADTGVGPLGALRRTPHRIALAARVVEAEARGHATEHLLGHLAGALAQLLERARLLLRGAFEVALAQRPLGPLHRFACALELPRRVEAELAQAPLQAAQHVAQLALAVAQGAELVTLAVARLLALALTLLTLLPLAALTLLAPLSALAALALAPLLAERVVQQLLLLTQQVAELVHHLAEALVLALVGHAARLQPVEQVAQLAQHLLGHVAVAGPRHVLQVAEHLLDVLRRHELAVAVHALHRRL